MPYLCISPIVAIYLCIHEDYFVCNAVMRVTPPFGATIISMLANRSTRWRTMCNLMRHIHCNCNAWSLLSCSVVRHECATRTLLPTTCNAYLLAHQMTMSARKRTAKRRNALDIFITWTFVASSQSLLYILAWVP